MKVIVLSISFIWLTTTCFCQEKVYKVSDFYASPGGGPGVSYHGNVRTSGDESYFLVYSAGTIDTKIIELNNEIKLLQDSLGVLSKQYNSFQLMIMDTVLNSIDNTKTVFSQEVVKKFREEILKSIKESDDKLRFDMQTKFDELTKKIH